MEIKTFRDDALAEPGSQNMILVRGTLISYHLATNRVAPLNSSTEIEFKPGVIYKVFTGISIEGVTCPFDIGVRPTAKLFSNGFEVKRVELINRNEIVVYVSTIVTFKFVKNEPMFEVAVLSQREGILPLISIQPDHSAPAPEKIYKEAIHLRELLPVPTPPVYIEADVNKKVSEWLNSPDTRGHEVDIDTDIAKKTYTGNASVSNTGPTSASAVADKLSKL